MAEMPSTHQDALISDLLSLIDELREMTEGPDYRRSLGAFFSFLFSATDLNIDRLQPLIAELGPRAEEVMLATAARLQTDRTPGCSGDQ